MAGVVVAVLLVLTLLWWTSSQLDDLPTSRQPSPSPTSGQPSGTPNPSSAATDPESGLRWVALDDLPAQAARTVKLIDAGGPFPYAKDGSTFGNVEGLLPDRRRGYYREYTVATPGESDRGARRIIGGGDDELYWTADHYASFERIRR